MDKTRGRSRWALLIAGALLAIVAVAVLAMQLPAASAHAARQRQVAALHEKQVGLASQTHAVTARVAVATSQVSAQQAKNAKLAKEIAAQRKQIAALRKKIKSLGG